MSGLLKRSASKDEDAEIVRGGFGAGSSVPAKSHQYELMCHWIERCGVKHYQYPYEYFFHVFRVWNMS